MAASSRVAVEEVDGAGLMIVVARFLGGATIGDVDDAGSDVATAARCVLKIASTVPVAFCTVDAGSWGEATFPFGDAGEDASRGLGTTAAAGGMESRARDECVKTRNVG